MEPVLLTGLLAIIAKNLVETLKHFANVGGDADSTYTRRKGLYALGAPVLLAALAALAQQNGAALDLLGELGVATSSPLLAAVLSGLAAGFAAPEAYDAQGLLKAKVAQNRATADAVDVDGDPV